MKTGSKLYDYISTVGTRMKKVYRKYDIAFDMLEIAGLIYLSFWFFKA